MVSVVSLKLNTTLLIYYFKQCDFSITQNNEEYKKINHISNYKTPCSGLQSGSYKDKSKF